MCHTKQWPVWDAHNKISFIDICRTERPRPRGEADDATPSRFQSPGNTSIGGFCHGQRQDMRPSNGIPWQCPGGGGSLQRVTESVSRQCTSGASSGSWAGVCASQAMWVSGGWGGWQGNKLATAHNLGGGVMAPPTPPHPGLLNTT